MAGEEKPKCPECDTEIVMVKDGDKLVPPDRCSKCDFRLKGFTGFRRWFAAAAKQYETSGKPKPGKEDDDDFLSGLRNL